MYYLDLTLPSPAENLACDEALLDACEEENSPPVLRFWESRENFVVVGYGNKILTEINVTFCEQHAIPILRRCTGGGAVLQGPGCLNYALILPIGQESSLHTVSAANRFIMQRQRDALASLLVETVQVHGYTDLTWNGRKFSGNSQRRKQKALLFHGSFLLGMNIDLIGRALAMPSKQPEYRRNRSHVDFLANIDLPPEKVKNAVCRIWEASQPLANFPDARLANLCREKYNVDSWHQKL